MLLLVLGLHDHQVIQHRHDRPHTAARKSPFRFWRKADMRRTQSMSQLGVKRTWLVAAHMSAYDPKRTSIKGEAANNPCRFEPRPPGT
jgi:hypothetical protein